MYGCMDGRMRGCKGPWMHGWTDGRMDGCICLELLDHCPQRNEVWVDDGVGLAICANRPDPFEEVQQDHPNERNER